MFVGLLLSGLVSANPLVVDVDGSHHLDWENLPLVDIRLPGEAIPPDAIVNGTAATGHPEVVALAGMANWGGYVFCSGTLIDSRWVLTAAHCVVEIPDMQQQGMDVMVLFGNDLINVGATDAIEQASWVAHPSYSDVQLSNDIGLIELSSAKTGVDLAVLNDEAPEASWVGEDMTFLGFGITSDNADDSGIKRTTDIAVDGWDSQFIVSYTPGTNLCSGDSGGAAFENTATGTQELAGVNSWVSPGCVGGSNGVTRVDQHIAWIQDYAPNVLLGGDGSGSNPGGGGSGTGTGGGGGGGGNLGAGDASEFDRDLGVPRTPQKGDYPVGIGCNAGTGGSAPLGLVVGLGLLGALRPRRRA